MKRRKIIVAALILSIVCLGTYFYTQKYNETKLSDLALANVEALAQWEDTPKGYCTMHIPCYDKYGMPTGLYAGFSYSGPNCNGSYHQHTCSNCKSSAI